MIQLLRKSEGATVKERLKNAAPKSQDWKLQDWKIKKWNEIVRLKRS